MQPQYSQTQPQPQYSQPQVQPQYSQTQPQPQYSQTQPQPQYSQTQERSYNESKQERIKNAVPTDEFGDRIYDYSKISNKEAARLWAELEVQFNIIRRKWPDFKITMPNPERETLEECNQRYKELVKQVHKERFLKNHYQKYRGYLILFWLFMEVFFGFFIKVNIFGYTKFQMKLLVRYEYDLIRIGEDAWSAEGGGGGSPILNIVITSVVTSLFFVLVKLLTLKTGIEADGSSINAILTAFLGPADPNEEQDEESSGLGGIGNILDMFSGAGGGGGGMQGIMNMVGEVFSGMKNQAPAGRPQGPRHPH